MTTKEEIKQALMDQMKEPSLSAEAFDEFNRRIQLLDSEE